MKKEIKSVSICITKSDSRSSKPDYTNNQEKK